MTILKTINWVNVVSFFTIVITSIAMWSGFWFALIALGVIK